MKSLYDSTVANEVTERIGRLSPQSARQWGRMDVAQMLAHCALAMEMALGETANLPRHPLGRLFGRRALNRFVVQGKRLKQGEPTHPSVMVTEARDFAVERGRLERAIGRFVNGKPAACTRHPHFFFGPMSPQEWATFMYVHLDHHLRQFGV